MSAYDEILKELETSYKQGEIDESTYKEKKQYYINLRDKNPTQDIIDTSLDIKAYGSQQIGSEKISISGMGRLQGGTVLKKIQVSGACRILHDIEINAMICSGWLRSKGSIKSHGDFHISGAAKVLGTVSANGLLSVSGSIKVKGPLSAEDLKISGRGIINGNLTSNKDADIDGFARIDGNVTADRVFFKNENQNSRFPRILRSKISGDIISKELVELEDVRVKGNIQGRIVKIGINCKIRGKIYYVDDLVLDGSIKLKEEPIKISLSELGK